jgi:hypothetical protein
MTALGTPSRTPPSLSAAARGLLRRAVEVYRDQPEREEWLRRQLVRIDEPLRVAIAGKVKAGKSTLLNALVGEEIAPTDAGECTRVVTWYRDGHAPKITMHPRDGAPRPLPIRRVDGRLAIDLDGQAPDDVDRLVVDWPSASLRTVTLIDTPGLASISADVSARTATVLTPEDEPAVADAVIYLMRHLHASDIDFLEAFRDQGVARATAVNTIAVLSRADEIGGGRLDALQSARSIARRYRADDKLRGLCQNVIAVAGLLAETGRTLRQSEFAALAALAALPRADADALVLSVDRFVSRSAESPVNVETRQALLDRLGLFGVRLSLTLIRQGVSEPSALAAELVGRSGLEDLQKLLTSQFGERQDLLKARSALLAVDQVLRLYPRPEAEPLAAEVERILAGAHEFAELRVLSALYARTVKLSPEAAAEAERLLGGSGLAPATRLGLERGAAPSELRDAALEAVNRWRRRAGNPLSSRAVADLSMVVVRSCEGILERLRRSQEPVSVSPASGGDG